ncbi:hypothetical protein H6P81_018679 [Aristolochia fimbriata]|uniref:Leucine-rich repeat-containing N-terminal plant-type domain-containing protein n=1 Tax=Aristolochia fimbriata TaxID=158543 RepID=A0AAV7E3X1_ARIFI|nr:hypothetical protein H6P81_018679 [Aristolochia fimbriata]
MGFCSRSGMMFLVVAVCVCEFLAVVSGSTYPGDIEALKELKRGVDSSSVTPGSCLSSWDFAYDPCDASFSDHFTCGFRCDAAVAGHGRNLLFLDASNNLLSGPLPANLPPSLIELSMRNNSFEGGIPSNWRTLTSLQVIDLGHNKLSGAVAPFLFEHPSLEQLTLSYNGFTSLQAPASYGLKSQLIAADIGDNELQGLLPAFVAMMPRLSALSLENNQFTGMIPSQYALKTVLPAPGTSPLARLLLSGNYLFGPIPSPLMGMKSGSATVSLVDNCLLRCPEEFFFCQGGPQKSPSDCRSFSPVIPLP